ncbi:MAG TPA: methyltransferase [Polyangiaceae bacterium]
MRDAGFTPSVRDVAGIVKLVASDDETLARDAERALVRVGPTAVPVVRAEAERVGKPARARLVRAVGVIAGDGEDAQAVAWLVAELARGEGKAARYAASALGKLREGAAQAERALLEAWSGEPPIELRRVLADSLGKVGREAAASALRGYESSDPELRRLLGKAMLRLDRVAARVEESAIDGAAALERPLPIMFRCRAGLESILVEELGEAWSPRAVEEGRVQGVLRGPLESARAPRVALSFALHVGPLSGADEGALVKELVAGDAAWRILRTFTRGAIRFRLAFESGGHRRGLVHDIAAHLRSARPEVLNDPTGSPWEILVRTHAAGARGSKGDKLHTVSLELEPRGLADERFDYRVSDVPAASQPTIAAALARIGGAQPDDVVWDPFVGSALELIERAKLGAYKAIHGTDVDEGALEAAKANLARAGIEGVKLAHADSTMHAPRGVSLAITNPPMGRRVARGELAPLLDRFVHKVAKTLVPGGRLVWLSPMPERTRGRLEEEGMVLEVARGVDMGGFRAELQRAVKKG